MTNLRLLGLHSHDVFLATSCEWRKAVSTKMTESELQPSNAHEVGPRTQPLPKMLHDTCNQLDACTFRNSKCKKVLKALKVSVAINGKIEAKCKIISMKMVQWQVSALHVAHVMQNLVTSFKNVSTHTQDLPHRRVRIKELNPWGNQIDVIQVDAPHLNGDKFVEGKRSLQPFYNNSSPSESRNPGFVATEYLDCRMYLRTQKWLQQEPKWWSF